MVLCFKKAKNIFSRLLSVNEYKFVKGRFQTEIEIKRSRFIATVFGEVDSVDAQTFVDEIKKTYPDARHNCYAYIGDELGNVAKFSDDGEPGGTAGQPMLEVLRKNGLVRTAVVVTRYFGGVKLGTGGLLSAYTKAVVECLKVADIKTKKQAVECEIQCDYAQFATLEGYLSQKQFVLVSKEYGDNVLAKVFVTPKMLKQFEEKIMENTNGGAKIVYGETRFIEF